MTDTNTITRNDVLITAAELKALLDERADVVVLDARFDVTIEKFRPASQLAHIPGAVYVDQATELAGPSSREAGRRPLPSIHDLQRDARRWGINNASRVVVYDDRKNVKAARAWWVLRWAGFENVRLLDGGFAAWEAAGYPTTTEISLSATGDVILSEGHLPVVDPDAAFAVAGEGVLFDARGHDAYVGDPAKDGTGHIPGAINADTDGSVRPDGSFLSPEELRERFAALGAADAPAVAAYCGGGVAAAHLVAALRIAGIDAALFPGSWSQWSGDVSRPRVTGAAPL